MVNSTEHLPSGWRTRSAVAVENRRLRSLGKNKYGIVFASCTQQPLISVTIPRAFAHDVRQVARGQITKAVREVKSQSSRNSIHTASVAAFRAGAISAKTLKQDTAVSRRRNQSEHFTSNEQRSWAKAFISDTNGCNTVLLESTSPSQEASSCVGGPEETLLVCRSPDIPGAAVEEDIPVSSGDHNSPCDEQDSSQVSYAEVGAAHFDPTAVAGDSYAC